MSKSELLHKCALCHSYYFIPMSDGYLKKNFWRDFLSIEMK